MWTAQEGRAHVTKELLDRGANAATRDKVFNVVVTAMLCGESHCNRLVLALSCKPVKMATWEW